MEIFKRKLESLDIPKPVKLKVIHNVKQSFENEKNKKYSIKFTNPFKPEKYKSYIKDLINSTDPSKFDPAYYKYKRQELLKEEKEENKVFLKKLNENHPDIYSTILIKDTVPKYQSQNYSLDTVDMKENIFQISPLITENGKIEKKIDRRFDTMNKSDFNYITELTSNLNDRFSKVNFSKDEPSFLDYLNTRVPKYKDCLSQEKVREILNTISANERANSEVKSIITDGDLHTIDIMFDKKIEVKKNFHKKSYLSTEKTQRKSLVKKLLLNSYSNVGVKIPNYENQDVFNSKSNQNEERNALSRQSKTINYNVDEGGEVIEELLKELGNENKKLTQLKSIKSKNTPTSNVVKFSGSSNTNISREAATETLKKIQHRNSFNFQPIKFSTIKRKKTSKENENDSEINFNSANLSTIDQTGYYQRQRAEQIEKLYNRLNQNKDFTKTSHENEIWDYFNDFKDHNISKTFLKKMQRLSQAKVSKTSDIFELISRTKGISKAFEVEHLPSTKVNGKKNPIVENKIELLNATNKRVQSLDLNFLHSLYKAD